KYQAMEMKATTLSSVGPLGGARGASARGFGPSMATVSGQTSSLLTVSSSASSPASSASCAACQKPIKERYLLKALDQLWHEDCLKCACCDCRLGEVGSTLFTKANLILCKRDYLRLFGTTGMCSACNKTIPAFEMAMKLNGGRVYHLECFQCSQCNHRFCVGDRFHLHENRILCEYDFEEMTVYGSNNNNNSSAATYSNHIEKLKKQTESLASSLSPPPVVNVNDDGSSGYGSPDSMSLSD
ncbi:PREDICTED: LIM domain only protein 3-like, partial [Rhagoletis zephyria]|uniref:LIM domain only protein 3-like n=1 Tax=Rhagoletis zephyria TaxID=28612 RepID=UPI000811A3B4